MLIPVILLCSEQGGKYSGFLSAMFNGTPGGATGAGCGKDAWSWPVLDTIILLGVGPVDTQSISVQVRRQPSV